MKLGKYPRKPLIRGFRGLHRRIPVSRGRRAGRGAGVQGAEPTERAEAPPSLPARSEAEADRLRPTAAEVCVFLNRELGFAASPDRVTVHLSLHTSAMA